MSSPSLNILINAYRLMYTAKAMADTYEANRSICKYVHSTSRGHEAIQLATAFNLLPCDYVSPYYVDYIPFQRDEHDLKLLLMY